MKQQIRRFIKAGIALLSAILLALSSIGAGAVSVQAAGSSSSVSEARSGVVRILSIFEGTCSEWDGSVTYLVTGSGFGVGTAGEETDIFVTNRHVVAGFEESWPIYDFIYYVNGSDIANAAYEYYLQTNLDLTTYYTTIDFTLVRTYILLDDYAYSNVTGLDTSRMVPCNIVDMNDGDEPDLAILQASEIVEGRVALYLASAEDGSLTVGDTVYAIGYPGLSDYLVTDSSGNVDYAADVEDSTVTDGIVSRLVKMSDVNDMVIQHTAEINAGNSGGPLINEDGAVIGVNTTTVTSSSEGTADYYISMTSDEVMELLDDNGIPYDTYSESTGIPVVLIVVIAAAVIAVIAAAVVLSRRKKSDAPEAQPQPEPAQPQPTQAGSQATQPQPEPIQPQPEPTQPQPEPIAGDSGLRIQAVSGVFAGRRFAIQGRLRIGRDPQRNDLVYPEGTKGISGVHCELTVVNGIVYLTDTGSTYGTYLQGGQRLAASQSTPLQPGDSFYLATETERFVIARKGE